MARKGSRADGNASSSPSISPCSPCRASVSYSPLRRGKRRTGKASSTGRVRDSTERKKLTPSKNNSGKAADNGKKTGATATANPERAAKENNANGRRHCVDSKKDVPVVKPGSTKYGTASASTDSMSDSDSEDDAGQTSIAAVAVSTCVSETSPNHQNDPVSQVTAVNASVADEKETDVPKDIDGKDAVDQQKSNRESGQSDGENDDQKDTEDMHVRRMQSALLALRERRAELQEVNAQLRDAQEESDSLKTELGKVRSELEEAMVNSKKTQSDLVMTRSELEKMRETSSTLSSDLADARGKLDAELKAKGELQLETNKLRADLDSSLSKARDLQQENAVMLSDNQSLKMRVNSAQEELERESSAKTALIVDMEALKQELAGARDSENSLKEQSGTMRTQIDDMREQGASEWVLGDLRKGLQTRMEIAWQNVWTGFLDSHKSSNELGVPSEIGHVPAHRGGSVEHASLRSACSSTKERRQCVKFAEENCMVSATYVVSYKKALEDLWYVLPDESVSCDSCDKSVRKSDGTLQGSATSSKFMHDRFLCVECAAMGPPASTTVAKPSQLQNQVRTDPPSTQELPPSLNNGSAVLSQSSATTQARKRSRSGDRKRRRKEHDAKSLRKDRDEHGKEAQKKVSKRSEEKRIRKEGKVSKDPKDKHERESKSDKPAKEDSHKHKKERRNAKAD